MDFNDALLIDYFTGMVLVYWISFYRSLPNPIVNDQLKELIFNNQILYSALEFIIA